jgi:glucokinase
MEIPVAFANDAGAAAFGEYWVGSGKEYKSIAMLTLGTGVGGGIIIEGKSIDGDNSHGSECGHVIVDTTAEARICSCGRLGHLEAYASATGLVARTREALTRGETSSLANRVAAGETLNGLMISQAAEAGDKLARKIVFETADYLAIGCASLTHIIDPAALILGGAVNFGGHRTEIGRAFLQRVDAQVRSKVFPTQAKRIVIDFAKLSGDAGFIGSAGLARKLFRKQKRLDEKVMV